MLPFVLKFADSPVENIHLTGAESQAARANGAVLPDIEVDVQIEFYSREINGVQSAQQLLQGAIEKAYQEFIGFLRTVAHPVQFLPFGLLQQFSTRNYCLILSTARARELFELCQMQPDARHTVLQYGGYELTIIARRQLGDTIGFLVEPKKHALFIRQVREEGTIRFYRSSFMHLTRAAPPAFSLDTREIIQNVRMELVGQTERAMPIEQLLMFPPGADAVAVSEGRITSCPECGGRVKPLGREGHFCLYCDWDDLPVNFPKGTVHKRLTAIEG